MLCIGEEAVRWISYTIEKRALMTRFRKRANGFRQWWPMPAIFPDGPALFDVATCTTARSTLVMFADRFGKAQ